ncbi:MAG: lytic transglycosylase domain-containing protein [Alphaproteobacteria bacterium]
MSDTISARRRSVRGAFAALAAAALLACPSAGGAAERTVPPRLDRAAEAAVLAATRADFAGARQTLAGSEDRADNKAAAKLVEWLAILNDVSPPGFEQITRFIAENKHWPSQSKLARRADEAAEMASDAAVLAWYKGRTPRSAAGGERLAEALERGGSRTAAEAEIRRVWAEYDMSYRDMRQFYARHKRILRAADHNARVNRLLWKGRDEAARQMLQYLEHDQRLLADARLRLQNMGPGTDRAVDRVPAALQNDPGLIFDRARWRRKKGREADAVALFKTLRVPEAFAEDAWPERALMARKALLMGEVSAAHRIASHHDLKDGAAYSEAIWLTGWIALRFLNESREASTQFERMHQAVRTPISRARAAYWAGRAAEARSDRAGAQAWYGRAATYFTTFYGQLAAEKLPEHERPQIPASATALTASAPDEATVGNGELARAARLLAAANRPDLARTFLARLAEIGQSPAEKLAAVRIAQEIGGLELVVAVGKEAIRNDSPFVGEAYPSIEIATGRLEHALMLAVTRQESGFDREALSPAGARGLMQLMPATARMMAKKLGIDFADHRLTDPHYNIRLGSNYLADMVDNYGGHYVLALAAYNAGPGRVRTWLGDHGDPRANGVDLIDWIELIPYSETRSYVQRVVEGLRVYRVLTGSAPQVAAAFDRGQGR